ncbi:hypothetical protein TWF694_002885 [Orbilia ellipsospora]|uniref:Uncharacterized protein n=1 Tax=Orbilia ellipsospora TaxID=2528407 RepID=A0AAV9X2B0_9PEZI
MPTALDYLMTAPSLPQPSSCFFFIAPNSNYQELLRKATLILSLQRKPKLQTLATLVNKANKMLTTIFFKVVFALTFLLALGPFARVNCAVIPHTGNTESVNRTHYITLGNGTRMPLAPLTVSGEYYPGGPTYELTGTSLEHIEHQLKQNPLFNPSAFGNSTISDSEHDDASLEKCNQQIYACQRVNAEGEFGVEPKNVLPAIAKLRSPAFENAWCYAPAGHCSNLACNHYAAVALCSWRTTVVKVHCGSAAGYHAKVLANLMSKDVAIGPNWTVRNPCSGWNWIPPKFYTGRSFWDADPSWDVRVQAWAGDSCAPQ